MEHVFRTFNVVVVCARARVCAISEECNRNPTLALQRMVAGACGGI